MNRSSENANRITLGGCARGVLFGLVTLLAACTQGPGGGGIGLGSGQDPDPATVDFPIFYIRHQIPEDQDDVTRLRPFIEDDEYSATLWKRDRASPGAAETEITARLRTEAMGGEAEDRYDIKDLAVVPRRPARWPSRCADRSTTPTTRTSRRPGTSGNTTSRPTPCVA